MRLPSRLHSFLERPDALRWTVVLAVLLCLPALGTGWILHDHLHHAMVRSWETFPSLVRAPDSLSAYVLDDPAWTAWAHERGMLPWYASSELHVRLWRPLASLATYVDHAWASSAVVAHLHGLAWYAACVWIVGRLFRRILGPGWVAALATLLFAVDEAHALPVAWAADRSTLMVTTFGVGALLAHVHWRRTERPSFGLASAACMVLALMSGEMALCFVGYILAFAAFLDQGPLRGRLLSVAPCFAVFAAWRVMYVVGGYGIEGSGLYIAPGDESGGFLPAVLERVPTLLLAQLTPIPSLVAFVVDRPLLLALAAALVVVVLIVIAQRSLRHDPRAWFLLSGMILAAIPLAVTLPQDRLLMPSSVGGAGWVALLLASVHVRDALGRAPRAARGLAGFWLASHLVLAPLLLPLGILGARLVGSFYEAAPRSLAPLDVENKTVVFVTGPDWVSTSWAPILLHHADAPIPSRVRTLGATTGEVVVRRKDARTLELSCATGFLDMPLDRLVWSRSRPFRVGQGVELSDVSVRVGRVTRDGRPRRVRFRFEEPLDSPRYVWVRWTPAGYARFDLPAVGEEATIEPVSRGDLFRMAWRTAW